MCLALASPALARAQTSTPSGTPAAGFLTRAAVSFEWAKLASSDRRFSWDGRITGDFDLADYRAGRINLVVDYEAVLGRERRSFDLNHGNYIIDLAITRRFPDAEIAAIYHHESRHLSDRSNPPAVSWNVIGVRLRRTVTLAGGSVAVTFQAGRAIQQAFVDYRWTTDLALEVRRPVAARAALYGRGTGGFIGVDRLVAGRKRQCGADLEGGVRIDGVSAAAEFFVGYERRIDAFPVDRGRVRMFSVGVRLTTR